MFLETERLLLRRFTAADADNLCALDSDPAVMRYLNGVVPTPRDVIERALALVQQYVPESCSLVDELLAERRQEAERA